MRPNYEPIETVGPWRIVRSRAGTLYIAWYDRDARQQRRASLSTRSVAEACAVAQNLIDRKVSGDPRNALKGPRIESVADLLQWHAAHAAELHSAETEEISIRFLLRSHIGERRLASLLPADFEKLKSDWLVQGASIATVSRRLSTLRSALRRAMAERCVSTHDIPRIPEFRTKAHIRAARPKGDPTTPVVLAKLYDAMSEPHLQLYLALLFSTAGRSGALLELTGRQIDRQAGLINLSPQDQVQTRKYRAIIPIQNHLHPWLETLPAGRMILWRDTPVASVKTGIREAVKRAGLSSRINSYSVRHSAGRFMRRCRVPTEEIAIWLGHIAPPENPETTLIYSPYDPDYLRTAKRAIEEFIAEIAAHAKTPLLEPPTAVRLLLKRAAQRENDLR